MEILSRVPPKVLVRFRAVSKQWNTLFDDKKFLNNHKMTFRFILATEHKVYSVSIDPVIVVRELPLGTPGLESLEPEDMHYKKTCVLGLLVVTLFSVAKKSDAIVTILGQISNYITSRWKTVRK
ncbi:hypothetical protein CARUB_v10015652mg [Capsella rubella]|uniref:F-box domain-containing protein n=1 Tax=Capsella rubella TaxID=81985 RepID=R0I368_9BRAS|nr:hypothetical protein CARUB_v10015652mg [Capsella rubella]